MNLPPSTSRRGFLTAAGTLGTAVGLGSAQTTRMIGTTTSSKDAPTPDWTFPGSSAESTRFVYPVSTTDGLVVVISASQIDSGDPKYILSALDVDDGHTEWSNTYAGISLPTVEDGTIYLPTGDATSDTQRKQKLSAIDVRTGTERWTTPIRSYTNTVTVDGGNVYLFLRVTKSLVALDANSGDTIWKRSIDSPYASELLIRDGALFLDGGGVIYSFATEDGSERWRKAVHGSGSLLYSETERNVYIRSSHTVQALDADDGSVVWSSPGEGELVMADGTLYSCGSTVRAVDASDGSLKWEYDDGGDGFYRSPTVADGTVFGIDSKNIVHAVGSDGTKRWSHTFDAHENQLGRYFLDVSDGSVYLTLGRTLFVISSEDGSVNWSFTAERPMIHSLVTDDAVFFGTSNELYTFDRQHSLLSTAVDGTSEFLTSAPGLGLSGILVGTAAFAAYRRFNDDGDSTAAAAESSAEPEPEYGRLERLSADEFTETYRVRKRTDDGPKIVAERQLTDPRVAGTFRSGVERWAELNDRTGVVPVLETDGDGIELPYYEDGSLADSDRSLSDRLDALSAASTVVHDAHTDGLIHGGLTPQSIFLDGDDASVADWEVGSALAEFRDSADSVPYDAPEQVAGEKADERTDVYRLGAIAAFVLTGKNPDEGSLRALDPTHREVMLAQAGPQEFESLRDDPISEDLHEIISKAMAEDPDDRYESVVAFDDMLRWAAFRA